MTLQLDHVVIAVNDLDQAILDYEQLGFTVIRGGVHANQATHNALIVFSDGVYFELLAATGQTPLPDRVDFSRMLAGGEGLVGFALRTDDLENEVRRLQYAGFAVGAVVPGSREKNGRVIQWQLALIDDDFAPFLIQDVTPREWRVPHDPDLIAHKNRSVGVPAVEVAVRDREVSWKRFTRLMGITPDLYAAHRRTIGSIVLDEYMAYASKFDDLPDHRKLFAGKVPQEEIDRANPDDEPETFGIWKKAADQSAEEFRRQAAREREIDLALGDKPEALFAMRLIREAAPNDTFTPERTHGVRFQLLTGVPSDRGMDILKGLNDVDWSAVSHAYGPATDVPDLLRALTSDDKAVRDYAQGMFIGSLIHQGTIYAASVETIPLLVQMIDSPEVDPTAPLDLLGYITFGGIETPDLKDETRNKLRAALPIFIRNLSHSDAQVREYMAEQLALYPDEVESLAPLLQQRMATDSEPGVRARCISTLAALWAGYHRDPPQTGLSDQHQTFIGGILRDSSYPMVMRFHAALALIRNHPDQWLEESVTFFNRMLEADSETLESLSSTGERGTFFMISDALSDHPATALQWLLTQAKNPDSRIRGLVGFPLGQIARAGQPVAAMLPVMRDLLDDPVPDVRQSAVNFFYNTPHASTVIDKLREMAENDPSVTVRTIARNALGFIHE